MSNLEDDMDLVPTAQPEEEEDQEEEYADQEEEEQDAEEEEATATEAVEALVEEEEKDFVENDNTAREEGEEGEDNETSMVERQEPEQERELVEEDEQEVEFPQIVQREPSAVALAMPMSPSRNSPTLDDTNNSNNTAPLTPTTQANLEPSATVKYLLEPSHQVITIACSLKTLVKDLRSQLASQLKMRSDYIRFILHDEGLLEFNYYFLNKIRFYF